VEGDEELAAFRQLLTGPFAFELLGEGRGRVLARLQVGSGKTQWMHRIIAHALAEGLADLVVVLAPRWDLLEEIRSGLATTEKPVLLRPRPRQRCGPLNEAWLEYERAGCGVLGREQICKHCPRRQGCPWPGQYGKALRGRRLILAAQAHLQVNPGFLGHLRRQTGAARPLLLVDEADLLVRPVERTIGPEDMRRFVEAQQAVGGPGAASSGEAPRWLSLSRLFAAATTADLREGDWAFPRPGRAWALAVQRRGREMFGASFRFPGDDLAHFRNSDVASREGLADGTVRFATPPDLGERFIVFSASMAPGLARYRVDPDHRRPPPLSPFGGVEFSHPGTRWLNVAGLEATAKYFPGNASRIISLFGQLVARNVRSGKRTLLVARKRFVPLCASLMEKMLSRLGLRGVELVTGGWRDRDLGDPRVVPIISFGMVGVNLFEEHENVYCLTSYLAREEAVAQALRDIEPGYAHYPVRLECAGEPLRRRAVVELPAGERPILPALAEELLIFREGDLVVQAVGRVRPFTRPREVITLHPGALPGVRYDVELTTLAQLRAFLRLPALAASERADRARRASQLKALGLTREGIARELKVSVSSVKRYLRGGVSGDDS
jgi:hypothetical protein